MRVVVLSLVYKVGYENCEVFLNLIIELDVPVDVPNTNICTLQNDDRHLRVCAFSALVLATTCIELVL